MYALNDHESRGARRKAGPDITYYIGRDVEVEETCSALATCFYMFHHAQLKASSCQLLHLKTYTAIDLQSYANTQNRFIHKLIWVHETRSGHFPASPLHEPFQRHT